MVPVNSNCVTKADLVLGGKGLLMAALLESGEGSKPWDVGREERISF